LEEDTFRPPWLKRISWRFSALRRRDETLSLDSLELDLDRFE